MNSILRPFLMLLVSLTLVGCGSGISQANYAKIKNEMTEAEVQAILGKPTETTSNSIGGFSMTGSTWEDKNVTISIQFVNGKVKASQLSLKTAKEDKSR